MTYVCNITKTQSHNGRRLKTRAYSLTKNHGIFGMMKAIAKMAIKTTV